MQNSSVAQWQNSKIYVLLPLPAPPQPKTEIFIDCDVTFPYQWHSLQKHNSLQNSSQTVAIRMFKNSMKKKRVLMVMFSINNTPLGLFILKGVQSKIATTVGHSGKWPANHLQWAIECQRTYLGTR